MWAWWLLFLLFAAALGYFATWYFVNNRMPGKGIPIDDLPAESLESFPIKLPRAGSRKMNSSLESRLQSIESKVNQYTNGQQDLIVKLAKLEGMQSIGGHAKDLSQSVNDSEEWEDMYYEAREAKEQLEEQAEEAARLLKEKDLIIAELSQKETAGDQNKSAEPDTATLEKIAELELRLNSAIREKEALRALTSQEDLSKVTDSLKKENARLKSELEDMHKYADSLLRKSFQIESKLENLTRLKTELHNKEDERTALRETVEDIFSENEKLANKIKDLQAKLKDTDLSHNPTGIKI